jgi:iron complex outermembrane receptor protein
MVLLLGVPQPGLAQDLQDPDASLGADPAPIEEIIVTGSRIQRDTYTSISPLQIITADVSREAGLIDPATILQESTPASGLQVDNTWQGYVLDNGPGASNISLRGLGIDRTLVLINGRRVAPAGVEGAPASPDLNLVPSTLVQQYDILLDGASSIYGSDAIAGVVNIILRKDFDGPEIEGYVRSPQQGGGVESTLSLAWGRNFSRGHVGFGVEYHDHEPVTLNDRRWSDECTRDIEIDENGVIRTTNIYYQEHRDIAPKDCTFRLPAGRIQLDDLRAYVGGVDPGPGALYYTPGSTNIGIPGFTESHHSALPGGMDVDGDGVQDVDFFDYLLNQHEGNRQLYPDLERIAALAYGEYTFAGDARLTPFFELHYNRRDVLANAGEPQLFPWVPPDNPYNVCNPNGVAGVDCFLAINDFYNEPHVVDRTVAEYGAPPQFFGLGLNPPLGGIWVQAQVRVADDRNFVDTSVEQTRFVTGVRGDLPSLDWGSLSNWNFELAYVLSKSSGTAVRPGIREDWLNQSLFTSMVDPNTGEVVCGIDTSGDGIPDGVNADGRTCVPINMFAPSLYQPIIGDFATQAERDYLFDTRDFDTEYDQWIVTGLIRGDLFQMPAGTAAAVLGAEYRHDEIESIADQVASEGLFFSFFHDDGATGRKYTRELFGEVEFPLLVNATAARELILNVSGRYTQDQYFGSDTTYSGKLGWRPVDSLLLRATTGTSFRAPNARENFLKELTGPWRVIDPCAIPEDALELGGGYNPDLDTRDPHVLQNCLDNGVDPTTLDLGGNNIYVTDSIRGGTTELVPETSKSYSYGFVWDQPIFRAFDFTFGATYYEIEVENSIIEPTAQFVVDDCYGSANLNSVLCGRIERDPDTAVIDFISARYLNRDQLLVSGYDVNIAYGQSVNWFGELVDLSMDIVLNHPKEASQTFTDGEGNVDYEDQAGEWGYPDWKGNATVRADIRDLRLSWSTRYIGAVDQDPAEIDEWDDIYGIADTCRGPTEGDVLCRDVGFADDYFMHSMSVYYYGDTWTIGGGVRNVFDEPPPMVDPSEALDSVRNMPLGYGYDLNGRTFFLNIAARFE